MRAALLFLILLCGCASEITSLDGYLKPKQVEKYKTVDNLKRHFFTDEAYEAIKDIPAIHGYSGHGWAPGVNIWTNIGSFLTLTGVGRRVITPPARTLMHGYKIFVHEYIHHLDDMDRDGEGDWIDHEEFRKAYTKMANNPEYFERIGWIEGLANRWYTDLFGVGFMSEHIAYSADYLFMYGGPDYMWDVFKKILRGANERAK